MEKDSRDYLEFAYRSIGIFSGDGSVNFKALNSLLDLAFKQKQIGENEIRVMNSIISKMSAKELTGKVLAKIKKIEKKYKIKLV